MWTEEKILATYAQIMRELTEVEFDKAPQFRCEKLLGEKINLNARDLVVLLNQIEAVFDVSIPDDFICNGNFDTYDHILELLLQLLDK